MLRMLVVEKAAVLLGGSVLVDTEGAQRQVVRRHRHRPLSLRLMLLVIYALLLCVRHLACRRVALSARREPAFIIRFHLYLISLRTKGFVLLVSVVDD